VTFSLQRVPVRPLLRSAALLFFAAALLPAAHALIPSVTVSPTTFNSGDRLQVSLSGLANANVLFWLDTDSNGHLDPEEPFYQFPTQTDDTGAVPTFTWTLPDIPAGQYFLRVGICSAAPVAGLCYGTPGLAEALVTVNLGLSTSKFGSGSTLTVTGFAFPANSGVHVWFDKNSAGIFSSAMASVSPSTDSAGAFSVPFALTASPGDYFLHSGASSSADFSVPVHIGSCWFQDCYINGADTLCLIGQSPTDFQFFGVSLADCKAVDSNYTKPTPVTAANSPPGGYDFSNAGPVFLGAGVLAAATADLAPPGIPNLPGIPGSPCSAMAASIASAEGFHGVAVPDKVSLLGIACSQPPFAGLVPYIAAVNASGHGVPDAPFILTAINTVKAAAAAGLPTSLPVLLALQQQLADATVAGAVACGYANYYCYGSDVTANILQHPDLQTKLITFLPLQLDKRNPNPCVAAGENGRCWGDLIGWGQVVCTDLTSGSCELPDANGNFPFLPVPGSAGSPDNSGAPIKCASGAVLGVSIGYDGDLSFDVNGPEVTALVNYHNFELGPGGSDPPNGIDIEIPLSDRPKFLDDLTQLRPGSLVNVCGRWVADMHQLWNELHPLTSLSFLPPRPILHPAAWIQVVASTAMLGGED
jgi:hypothetical protein